MILVYLEQNKGKLPKGALVTLGAAFAAKAQHGYKKVVGVIVGGDEAESAAKEAANYGLDEVIFVKGAEFATSLALPLTQALFEVATDTNPTLILGLASTRGKDVFPRLAAELGAGQASDVLAFVGGGEFKRPMYAGNIIATVGLTSKKKLVTIRGTAFEPAGTKEEQSPIREFSISGEVPKGQEFISFETTESARPELTEAEVVVSGGRALRSKENFEKYMMPLADVLGAAIGASRAAVDSGYAPNDWQIGQTGKVVAPNLYIAIGISGAIQHLAGMKDSRVIVAVNKDPDAPIFEVADYGLVADLYEVVPELTDAISKAKS